MKVRIPHSAAVVLVHESVPLSAEFVQLVAAKDENFQLPTSEGCASSFLLQAVANAKAKSTTSVWVNLLFIMRLFGLGYAN